ncbi:aminoglycoside 6'-N-acetyltransferase [Virgibacillus sp. SK37]|uniref:aminoglycoside 6'-N-acetyltransferase n=1 Tax=Virgibacillus sp. SK37 TaxID=403957 RepID=UPI0004D1191B|nr:aminoglycoside 6'-N-acetyltransferase [Virgibacillus sp. SK37]AIF42890.1 aminoglycoside 6-adenylyltransferase [Virgibacillus sp. SK37]
MLKEATLQEVKKVADLALRLWSNHTLEELNQEITHVISQPDSKIILSYHANEVIGFAQCQLRYDYVEGTSSSPVGYLEGLFVKEEFRKQDVARSLVSTCEEWAKEKGCREFASDCELENVESLVMHQKLGFGEANRIICFKKDL